MTISFPGKGSGVITLSPMTSNSIPKPKIQYRFKVLFKTVTGILDEASQALTMNMVTVSKFKDAGPNMLGLLMSENVTFTFVDDVEDLVYDGIQIVKNSPELEIELQYLDGDDNVLRAFKFEEPNIGIVEYSALDYGSSDGLHIKMTVEYNGLTKIRT
jgi:hypothetical protein